MLIEVGIELLTPLDHPVTVVDVRTVLFFQRNNVTSAQTLLAFDGLYTFVVLQRFYQLLLIVVVHVH